MHIIYYKFSGISEFGSSTHRYNIRCGKKRTFSESLDTEINIKHIKTETNKKIKTEKIDNASKQPKTSKFVVNPFAINNKRVIPSPLKNRIRIESKRLNSGPPEIKLDIKRFKKENNSPEETFTKNKTKPETTKKQKKDQEKPKCTTFNVSSKTFPIKKCSIQIERCENIETAK